MTSGQGEPPGGPYGPPQGWNAPPPPPQYPGYAPAPSAPTGYGAPQAMERPTTVRAGLGIFLASMALSVVAQVVTLLNWQTIIDWTFANAQIEPGADTEAALAGAGVLGGTVVLAFLALPGLRAIEPGAGRRTSHRVVSE